MGLFSIFSRKKEPENYEEILESLRLSIQSRQARLSEIRLRERRTTLLLTLYAFAAWAVYVGVWYAGWLPDVHGRHSTKPTLRKLAFGVPVIIGPIVILFTRRIVQSWYTRIGNAEEETLKKLLIEQRNKVEELKKKTDYYSTQKLLERYDQPDPTKTPQKPIPGAMPGMATPQRPGAGAGGTVPQAPNPLTPQRPLASGAAAFNPALSPIPQAPPQRHWYDRIADAVLGEDTESPHTRFALVCQKCFTHNGLVRESEWEDTQYVCMNCGHLNPSPRQKRLHAAQQGSHLTAANGSLLMSPAGSAQTLTDDEKSGSGPGTTSKMEVDVDIDDS